MRPTPTGADKVFLFNYDHVGIRLADIESMGYATYRSSASTAPAVQAPSMNIEIDINGGALEAGDYAVLVFEPVYNGVQGAIADDSWQLWDAFAGGAAIWWSSRAIPGVCQFNCFVSWNAIVAANPDAVILGGFGVNQGSGNGGLLGATDALRIGYGGDAVTYDFEAFTVATSKDQCKAGGWMDVVRADGSPFANQGQCIRYINVGV